MGPIVCANTWEQVAELITEAKKVFDESGEENCLNMKLYAKRANIDQIL